MKGRANMAINGRMFDAVKLMIECGSEPREVADFMKISLTTVNRIIKAQDFSEYRNMVAYLAINAEKSRKKKPAQPEPGTKTDPILTDMKQPGGTISANYQINRMYDLLKKQVEMLTLISNKLAFIVCELGGGKDDAGGSDPKVS